MSENKENEYILLELDSKMLDHIQKADGKLIFLPNNEGVNAVAKIDNEKKVLKKIVTSNNLYPIFENMNSGCKHIDYEISELFYVE